MKTAALVVAGALALAAAHPGRASADSDYFGEDAPEDHITFRMDKPRTKQQRLLIGSMVGGAALFGGLGLFFHLDSRSKSNDITAVGEHTGRIYDADVDSTRDRAYRSRTLAIVGYSLGAASLIAAVVTLYVTEPGTRVVTVGDEKKNAPPKPTVPVSVVPVRGGAVIGGGWSF